MKVFRVCMCECRKFFLKYSFLITCHRKSDVNKIFKSNGMYRQMSKLFLLFIEFRFDSIRSLSKYFFNSDWLRLPNLWRYPRSLTLIFLLQYNSIKSARIFQLFCFDLFFDYIFMLLFCFVWFVTTFNEFFFFHFTSLKSNFSLFCKFRWPVSLDFEKFSIHMEKLQISTFLGLWFLFSFVDCQRSTKILNISTIEHCVL